LAGVNGAARVGLWLSIIAAAVVLITTLVCSADDMRNVIHASDLRITAVLWKKVFGEEYQISNAYYPKVCQRHPSSR